MSVKKRVKIIAMLVAVTISLGLVPQAAMAEDTAVWTLSGNALTVSGGVGATGSAPDAVDKSVVTSVVLGADIHEISPYAFADFPALETVTVNGTVNTIGEGAFSGCSNLRQYDFKEGLYYIKDYAFNGCGNLFIADKALPKSVESIGLSAFYRCQTLDLETLPDMVSLGTGAFAYTNMESLHVIPYIYTLSNVMGEGKGYQETSSEGIAPKCFYGSGLTEVTIVNETVGQEAFSFCKKLTKVNMPNARNLEWRSFANSENLILKEMPKNLCYLGGGVFYADKNVKADKMPDTMQSDWMADNFLGAGWYITVEVYAQNMARTDYDLFSTNLVPSHALWFASMDTSGDDPVLTTTCEGANANLEGQEIDNVYIGPDEIFTGTEMGELPDTIDFTLRHDDPESKRVDTAIEPCVFKVYYDRVESSFSVSVPTQLDIYMDERGVTTTATDVKITNWSNKKVQVSGLTIEGLNGWEVQDNATFDPANGLVDEKKFSMTINGESTLLPTEASPDAITFNQDNWVEIARYEGGENGVDFPVNYTAKVSLQSSPITEQIATVTFRFKMAP